MQDAFFCFTVDDVGMEGYSTEAHLEQHSAVLRRGGRSRRRSLWCRVLKGKPLRPGSAYAKLLAEALEAGHAVGQHGLDHDRFEAGIPPKMILDLPHEGPAREHLANHRDEIERSHTVENLRGRLREGRAILGGHRSGRTVEGFRAPCLSICDNLFTALEAEGYRYDSSQCFQKAAWDLINGKVNPVDMSDHAGDVSIRIKSPGECGSFP